MLTFIGVLCKEICFFIVHFCPCFSYRALFLFSHHFLLSSYSVSIFLYLQNCCVGNGLFALGALIQHSNVALEKIVNVEVVELLVSLLTAHAVDDASVAVYGINILEAIITFAVNKGDAIYSFLLKSLVTQKIGALLCHIMTVYSYNEMNCNVEILGRAVYLLYFLSVKSHPSGDKLTTTNTGRPDYGVVELKQQLVAAGAVALLQHAVLDNITVMDRVPNEQAQAIVTVLCK